MPTARNRSFNNRSNRTGTYQNYTLGTTTTRSALIGEWGTCDDTIGNFPLPNGLDLIRRNAQYPGLVGKRINATTGVVEREMSNFPVAYRPGPTDPRSVFPALTSLQKSNLSWTILSKANPSAPDVSLPTVLAEMKDIPSLMQSWYKLFVRRPRDPITKEFLFRGYLPPHWKLMLQRLPEIIASGHLTWRWAIAPFIRDIRKMCDFTFLMNKRLGELRKLKDGQTIRRRIPLGEDYQVIDEPNRILHSEGIVIRGTRRTAYTSKMWGTVKYKIPSEHAWFFKSDDDLVNLAKRLTYGLTSYEALATAWELMPWSWFVDWFTGIGTVINATNNTLGLVHSDCCLMRHSRSESEFIINPAVSESWASPNSDFFEAFDRKERYVVAPLIPFAPSYLPLCTGKAVSILASLAILQVRPGRNLSRIFSKPYRR